jgi:hypothetical protein
MDPKRPMTAQEAALEAARLRNPPLAPEPDNREIIADAARLAGEASGQSEQAGEAAEAIQHDEPTDASDDGSASAMPGGPDEVDEKTPTIDDGLDEASLSDEPPPLLDVAEAPANTDPIAFDESFEVAEPAPLVDTHADELAFDEAPSTPPLATESAGTTIADAVCWA